MATDPVLAEVREMKKQLAEVRTLLVRHLDRHRPKGRKLPVAKLSGIEIPEKGPLGVFRAPREFGPTATEWLRLIVQEAAVDRNPGEASHWAALLLQKIATSWNGVWQLMPVTQSGGYYHLLISSVLRARITACDLTGFRRRRRVPTKPTCILDLRERRIFSWGRIYLTPVLRRCRDECFKSHYGRCLWRKLALLGCPTLELKVDGHDWDLHEDNPHLYRQLPKVWSSLMELCDAFGRGLKSRKKIITGAPK